VEEKKQRRTIPYHQRNAEEKTAPDCPLSPEERGRKNSVGLSPLTRGARKKKQRRTVPSYQRNAEEKTAPDRPLSPEERRRKNSVGLSPLPYGERVRVRGNL